MKIDYHIMTGNGKVLCEDAKPVKIEGWEDFNFFIHKGDTFKWFITEVSTGRKVGHGSTRNQAIEYTILVLESNGKDRFKQIIQAKLEESNDSERIS